MSDKSRGRQKKSSKLGSILLGIFIIAAITSVLSILILTRIQAEYDTYLKGSLETVLKTTVEATENWVDEKKTEVAYIANTPRTAELIKRQIEHYENGDSLKTTESLTLLMEYMKNLQLSSEQFHFSVILPNEEVIASDDLNKVGMQVNISAKFPNYIERLKLGETLFIPPINSSLDAENKEATLYFCAPIYVEGEVAAILLQHLRPQDDFSNILYLGRIGTSGETYAFNQSGVMVSESRFNDHLEKAGLIEEGESSILSIEIRDPGVNLVTNQIENLQVEDFPYTVMAGSALKGTAGYNVEGYRDYRGVKVIGAWMWDDDLNIGVTSEIDFDEAMAPYKITRNAIVLFALCLLLMFSIASFLSRKRERRHQSVLERKNQDLKQQAEKLNALYESSLSLNRKSELSAVITKALLNLQSVLPYDLAFIALKEEDEFVIKECVSKDGICGNINNKYQYDLNVIMKNQLAPIIIDSQHELMKTIDFTENQMQSAMIIPLIYDNVLLGEMVIQSVDPEYFSSDNAKMAVAYSSHASVAIYNTQQYEVLRLAKQEAEKATEAKSKFLSRMSHEMRTPLNAVLGHSQILMRDRNISPDQKTSIGSIYQSGNHLLNVINDILDLSKIESEEIIISKEPFDVMRLIEDVKGMFQLKMEKKGLNFEIHVSERVPEFILGDLHRVKQILINLIGNGYKFTSSGHVKVMCDVDENELFFEIQDTGVGMTDEEMAYVFSAFKQAGGGSSMIKGTGLGLTISRELAILMGGNIEVRSEQNVGSQFKFHFPYEVSEEGALNVYVEEDDIDHLSPNDVGTRILVVDDNPENRAVITAMITPVGFQFKEAENGKIALDVYNEWKPDVILLDVEMPVMNGIEFIKHLRGFYKDAETKIIVLSANAFDSDRAKALEVGANKFLSKPVLRYKLLKSIGEVCEIEYVKNGDASSVEGKDKKDIHSQKVEVVDRSIIDELLHLCILGDLGMIEQMNQSLISEYPIFSEILGQFLEEYDINAIIKFVERNGQDDKTG